MIATSHSRSGRRELAPGLIFQMAESFGLSVPPLGDKRQIRCPFHEDRTPSAFLSIRNVFFCSVCTPERGLGVMAFEEAIRTGQLSLQLSTSTLRSDNPQSPSDAPHVWQLALAQTRDDSAIEEDADCYEYLRNRQLIESWEYGLFGILPNNAKLPRNIAWWPDAGYRIVAPLFDSSASIVNIQARSVRDSARKTVFPAGSTAKGVVFANSQGRQLLQGQWAGGCDVLLAEGLTDYLALSTLTGIPVLSAPGTAMAASCVGPWAMGMNVILAFDQDPAGDRATHAAARGVYEHGAQNVHRVAWPGGVVDACDALALVGPDALTEFLGRAVS